jgi:hypothetical protein
MRRFRKGQACRIKETTTLRTTYFSKKYGTGEPNVEIVGTIPDVYGKDWKARFLYIPECYAYLNHTKFALTEQVLAVRVVGVRGRKAGVEIVHPSELVRTLSPGARRSR